MPTFKFNKIVRDQTPEKLIEQGFSIKTRPLPKEEKAIALKEKLLEEAQEVRLAQTESELIEELGDVLEVIVAISRQAGIEMKAIHIAQEKKRQERGGFEQAIKIESVSKAEKENENCSFIQYFRANAAYEEMPE